MQKYKVIIWGASDNSIARCAEFLNVDNIEIEAFVDSNNKLHGKYVNSGNYTGTRGTFQWKYRSTRIISENEIKNYQFDFIMVSSLYYAKEITNQILKLSISEEKIILINKLNKYSCDNYDKYKDIFKLIYCHKNFPKVITLFEKIRENIDYNNGVLQFKDVRLPLNNFLSDRCIHLYEILDILQPYAFNENITDYIEGPYENGFVQIEKDDIVIDCGANVGIFSAYAAMKASNGKVYAFEPVSQIVNMLENTSALYDNIITMNFALSDRTGEQEIDISSIRENLGSASIVEYHNSSLSKKTETIKTLTIDDFIKKNNIERVDFIKADIEGAERLMLMGAQETIRRYSPKLSICTYHLEDDPQVLEEIIKDINPKYVIEHRWMKLFAHVPDNC